MRQFSTSGRLLAGVDPREETIYTDEHWEMRQALRKLIEKEINPYVDEWEGAKSFPAHKVGLTVRVMEEMWFYCKVRC